MFKDTLEKIIQKKVKIAIIGLGYVGLPLAHELSKTFNVIGFDIDTKVIDKCKNCQKGRNIKFSSNSQSLSEASIFIIAVPTPVGKDNKPDFSALINASRIVGEYLKKDSLVIYESTVYPGATEEICIPELEQVSKLRCKEEFKVGYSPERISPGDDEHGICKVIKVISGIDKEALQGVQHIYQKVVKAGIYPVSSIRIAEAIKVIENTQRDINIAFMNEMAMILKLFDIDSKEVFQGMGTKWNALNFTPGLVGGHCIGVDPYYLIHELEQKGYQSNILLEARKINESINYFICNQIINQFKKWKLQLKETKVLILGAAFKEDCDDVRNSKVVDIYESLEKSGIKTYIYDPLIDSEHFYREYKIKVSKDIEGKDVNGIVIAVPHQQFREISVDSINKLFGNVKKNNRLLFDVKSILQKDEVEQVGIRYMNL